MSNLTASSNSNSTSLHHVRIAALGLSLILLASGLVCPVIAQSAGNDAVSASVPAAATATTESIQNLVRWNGILPEAAGRSVEVRFALYQDQAGGLALWNETQTVNVGPDGRYSVLLGVTGAEGLPLSIFEGGAARWVEARTVRPGNDPNTADQETGRSLLTTVPYAFMSMNAENLAGRAAADYVTREDLQSAVANGIPPATQPNTGVFSPQLTGTGATGALAYWSNSTTLGSSAVQQAGERIGIGTAVPAATLDVNGDSALRGTAILPAALPASPLAGVGSPLLEISANAFVFPKPGQVAGSQSQTFAWQAVPIQNNTLAASAGLDLLFGSSNGVPTPTGLSIASNGQITFAAGQKFPGASSATITGVKAGTGLKGGGTEGVVSLAIDPTVLPTLASNNLFTGEANIFANAVKFEKPVTFAPGQTFPGPGGGTITSVATLSPITGGATAGSVTLGLNTPALENTLNGVYARLNAPNTFTQPITFAPGQTFLGSGTISGVIAGPGLVGGGSSGTVNLSIPAAGVNDAMLSSSYAGTGSCPAGMAVTSLGRNSAPACRSFGSGSSGTLTGVIAGAGLTGGGTSGSPTLAINPSVVPLLSGASFSGPIAGTANVGYETGVYGTGTNGGTGIRGSSDTGYGIIGNFTESGRGGIFGYTGTSYSKTYDQFSEKQAGIWADSSVGGTAALWATSDSATTAVFVSSDGSPALELWDETSGSGEVFEADGKEQATCTIDTSGNLSCTGTISQYDAADNGTRQVETYSVQSAENWSEDAGTARLSHGSAHVELEPLFGQTVNTGMEYHVFLTPDGDCKGLYVSAKSAGGFDVREIGGGTSSIAFEYRIMAKRVGYENLRLSDVTEKRKQRMDRLANLHRPARDRTSSGPGLPAKERP